MYTLKAIFGWKYIYKKKGLQHLKIDGNFMHYTAVNIFIQLVDLFYRDTL